ncbi:MAG: hypothetical protein U5K51_09345 [Flavobacteriaceae bacterium]|nr:hypothetical protein [Flavobacteriaceae bacterium]
MVEAVALNQRAQGLYEIELYKDFPLVSGLLSGLKTNNKMLHVLASIYAKENGYQNCMSNQ